MASPGRLIRRDPAPFLGELSAAARVLIAAAAVTLVVHAVAEGLFGPAGTVILPGLIRALTSATWFLLAAAILIGAERWPAGRTWLLWGAAAFVLHGLLELGLEAWFVWWEAVGPQSFSGLQQTALIFRWVVSVAALTAAWLLVAVGVWSARPARTTIGGLGWLATMTVIGVLGLVATGAGLALSIPVAESTASPMSLVSAALYAVAALGSAATAVLAVAALRRVASRDDVPELLIACGATLIVAGTAWSQVFLARTQISSSSLAEIAWNITLPGAVVLLGTLTVIAGFAAGWLFPQPEAHD